MFEYIIVEVDEFMGCYCISGVLVVEIFENCKLVGILINWDFCFILDYN